MPGMRISKDLACVFVVSTFSRDLPGGRAVLGVGGSFKSLFPANHFNAKIEWQAANACVHIFTNGISVRVRLIEKGGLWRSYKIVCSLNSACEFRK